MAVDSKKRAGGSGDRKQRRARGKRTAAACIILLLGIILACAAAGAAYADEACNITDECRISVSSSNHKKIDNIRDGQYTTYWESQKTSNPWITIHSEKPVYGLYLCFQEMPDSYVIQREKSNGQWETVCEGDTRFHHAFYALDGIKSIRIYATDNRKIIMGFNEVFVFGEGEIPDWVQRWEPVPEKAEILFLATHPDDDILFLGGAIAWYGVEQQRPVVVAYLTKSNTTRRSEALNGLWTLGIRTYPVFGEFRDCYSKTGKMADAYTDTGGKKKVQGWVTELYRRLKPEVVVTQDLNGEYGHPQHKMVADSAAAAYSLAADAAKFPESAEAYGTWQVKKLYIHLYGDKTEQTKFNWDVPLESLGGKTANEKAEEAYAMHVTQKNSGKKFNNVTVIFSVAEYGVKRYPNTAFGLYASEVGPDEKHDDFLENISDR